MKILQLDLAAFGPFANQTLDFSPGQCGLHLVYGPNEAGKSSMLRALRQVLYGIERQTSDDFRVPYKQMRLGATLLSHQGEELSFIRLKKDKNPLRSLSEEILDDNCLEPFLGHVDETMFVRQFGLNWQNLVDGGKEMIRSDGELGRVLFAAGSGLTALTQVQESIEKEMRELFLPAGTNPKINELCNRLKAAEDVLRQSRMSSQDWQRHAESLEEAERLQADFLKQKKALERTKNRLQRIHNAKIPIRKLREIQKELKRLEHVTILPPEFSKHRQQLRDQLLKARQSRDSLQTDITRNAEQSKLTTINEAVLNHAAEIESLYKEIEKYLSSVHDYPDINGKRQAAEDEARHLLKNMRADVPLENADELRLPEADRVLIRDLGPEHKALSEKVANTRKTVAETRKQFEELRRLQSEEAEVPDLSPLKSAVKLATKRGQLEDERNEKERALKAAEMATEAECKRLPFWNGTLEELEKIKVPFPDTVRNFQTRFDEASGKRQEIEQQYARAEATLKENAYDLKQLEQDGDVPTEEDLAKARELREEGWKLVQECWRDGGKPNAKLKAFLNQVEAPDLETGFAKAMAKADAVSDLLRKEALRVNEKCRLMASREKLEAALPELKAQLARCDEERAAIEADWNALWSPLGIEPGTPGEMRDWLHSHMNLTTTMKTLQQQRFNVEYLGNVIEEHRGQLIECLSDLGQSSKRLSKKPLAELIERAQEVLEDITEQANRKARLADEIKKLEQSLPNQGQEAQDAEAELAAWRKKWARLMEKIGLPEEATPSQANAILDTLDRVFEQLRKASEFAHRVKAMWDFNQSFEERVRAVALTTAWASGDASPTQVVQQLHEELTRAREALNKQQDLAEEHERQQRESKRLEQEIKQFETRLQEMCRQAGCADPEDLPKSEKDSARKEQLESDERETRDQVLQFVADSSFEEFLKEADAEETDELSGRISELERELDEVDRALARQIAVTQNERTLLEAKSGGNAAAIALEDRQAILAEMGQHLERYVQLRLALIALKEGAERYRKKHQGPVLKRASELFARLTCGSFQRLQNDGDEDGRPHLVGVRRHEGIEETVDVKGMSDGTADQLYLALRIASLEDWLEHHPPVPFILDDILINFDDQRAVAALQVLAELSQRTQVIFFTHHQHLVELAESNLSESVCFTHELGPAKPKRKRKAEPIKDPGAATLF